jgi:hypothetical protein
MLKNKDKDMILDELSSEIKHKLIELAILAYGNTSYLYQDDYSVIRDMMLEVAAKQTQNEVKNKHYSLAFGNYSNGYFFQMHHDSVKIKPDDVLDIKYYPFYNRILVGLYHPENNPKSSIWIDL